MSRLEPKTIIELRSGVQAHVTQDVAFVKRKLEARPPAQWIALTQLFGSPPQRAGHHRKRSVNIRQSDIIAYMPYEDEPNTG